MNLLHRAVFAICSLAVFTSTGSQRGGISLLYVENYSNHSNNGRPTFTSVHWQPIVNRLSHVYVCRWL